MSSPEDVLAKSHGEVVKPETIKRSIKKNWHQNHVGDQFQRNALSRGYQENSPEDWIMISDIDEIPDPKKASLKPYDFKLDIVYEDQDLLVLNKPSNISMHPGAGNYDNTIVNALMNYCGNKLSNIGDELRPGIVHRIDKDTSGLIVVAKNNLSHEDLSNQFNKHTINRVYQLLIWGKVRPSKGKIETFITRSSKNRQMMEVSNSKGKKAITNYKTLEVFENSNIPTLSSVSYTHLTLPTNREV